MAKQHLLFDKRQKKPKVIRITSTNEDITIQQIEKYNYGKVELQFVTPNFVSLFINAYQREFDTASSIYQEVIKPKQSQHFTLQISENDTVRMYDYFEHIQAAVVMIYSAVECLTNVLIPDDFTISEIGEGGAKLIRDKSYIELNYSTESKLKKIIPNALNIQNPSTFKCWSKFTELAKIRNNIIHMKSSAPKQEKEERKIISLLLNENIFNKLRSSFELIKEISKLNPFHHEFPILKNTETLEPIIVDRWEDKFSKTDV